ncbi:hypothetical protein SAMN05216553_11719 [Lentzea fradiae]|uniref:Uncharacterized protein n=1 Tax=Lentzea fradiae TaxID=200378 RepID=A0A1G8A713_9PSEU|nr:hypothetical protein [Lentzea fradiae]SDH16671.1 hypothetical protein SAMN05216553_11719 [Lentzea fradiae]
MGIVYCGPYADLIDSYDHEGYADRKLPGGKVGYVARCSCGWTGSTLFEPSEDGREAAGDEWDREHLQPLISEAKRAWHRWADRTGGALQNVANLVRDRQFGHASRVLGRLITELETRQRVVEGLADGRDE